MSTSHAVRAQAAAVALVVVNLVGGLPALQADSPRPVGDARVLATVPTPPGFPEGVAVRGGRVFVAGPATFGTTGGPPSAAMAFDRETGSLDRTYPMRGEDILAEHASSSIAFDGSGRLYVLNTQLGVVRIDPETNSQEIWGNPFPDLKPCSPATPAPCSPTITDTPALPNDLAFDDAGNLFVTDSMQATIWAFRPEGGDPIPWFQDTRLASAYIGVNGIRLNPSRSHVYFTVTADLSGGGHLYRLPRKTAPSALEVELVHTFAPGDLPDGIAFGVTGLVYVAMATPTRSGIAVVDDAGNEVRRFSNPEGSPFYPYDSPANLAFDGTGAALVTNHAFVSGAIDDRQFSVLDVYVEDSGSPLAAPVIP